MKGWRDVWVLIRKEATLEWRQRYALNGMALYLVSTIFVVYLTVSLRGVALEPRVWNALLWIILLFTAVNAIAKSFAQERAGRFLYYYTLLGPEYVILSKIIYNAGLMLLLTLLGCGAYALVLGSPVTDWALFGGSLVLGAVGFAGTLTMVAGIAAKAANNSTLMAILSFPVILPMLLLLVRVSALALRGMPYNDPTDEVITLLAIDFIVVTISLILFPYLWRS